ncbi:hypothetical protein [Methylomonas rosea]|uniref:HEPN domain-containing protein n=1 Tax=Methylomonas rosea TaxID=2952227 RepID=A0ABT1TZT7_9GAMM|nr:hypothetical protein [Methylomonas sp. WSC-7]MCQ8119628.1 hypothetical protein [Methylomonas sp. WSC-7]
MNSNISLTHQLLLMKSIKPLHTDIITNSMFSSGEDWKSNACVAWSPDAISLYIDGYRKAADELAHLVVGSARDRDILVYPIVFLYRQYIELQLKKVIRESKILLSEGNDFPQHHRIKDLWNDAKGLMRKIIKTVDSGAKEYITQKDVETIDKIIIDFEGVDPESFTFRYPKDKAGNDNLNGISHINIRNLHDQMELLTEKLEKYDLVVGLLREWQSDMYSTYAP